jgi:hypothetical protein
MSQTAEVKRRVTTPPRTETNLKHDEGKTCNENTKDDRSRQRIEFVLGFPALLFW